MYAGAEDLQGLAPPAPRPGRHAATVATLIALSGSVASAEPEPELRAGGSTPPAGAVRPAVTRHGWQLDVSGYVQVDSSPWSQDSVDELDPSTRAPLNEERFSIRRGRLRAEARRDGFSGAIEFDGNTVNGATARLLGAQVRYAYPARGEPLVAVTAGLFKTPFGAEVPASERDKPFLEPPAFARALFPGNYDAGVMASGSYGVARWTIGLVNGAPVGDAQWAGRDPVARHDIVGRLGAAVAGPYRARFEAGISAITGQGLHPGAPPTKDELQWVDENQDGIVQTTELQVVPGMTATPSQPFDRDALGADFQARWCLRRLGAGAAYVEAVIATNLDRGLVYADPVATSRDLRHLGVAIGAVQSLGPHVEVGARYDRYDADRDARERAGVSLVGVEKVFSTLAVMAAARWPMRGWAGSASAPGTEARVLIQYDHERNPFGRGDDGMPTTRESDRVTVRAQVGF